MKVVTTTAHRLYLLVTQTGGASWAYRYKVNGKERWMGLGELYDVNLDEARERHWNARQLLKKDKVDPLDKRKAERDARALAEVWRTVVDSMSADHFIPANYHLLTQLCRHVVEARRIAQLIKAYRKKKTDFNIRVCGELLKAQLSESSIIQRLSCSMRLTQQSNFHQSRRLPGPTISNRNPWDEKW